MAIKVAQGAAGIVTAILILRFFSPAVQGFYYTFASILGLQIFLELGLSAVINTFAAHEWAKLSLDGDGRIRGDAHSLARLKSLTRKVAKWYVIGGALLFVLLVIGGFWFFGAHDEVSEVSWKKQWLAMCLLASVGFILTPAWALLTGCGQLATLNSFRMLEIVIRYAVLWGCMAANAALWAVVAAIGVSTVVNYIFLFTRYGRFFRTLIIEAGGDEFSWLKELAPLQLRIALSWMSGYLIYSLFAPAMFHFHGAEEAGRMGMTWALLIGLSGVAGTWLQVKSPEFAMMIARKEYASLDSMAWRTALVGVAVFLLGSLVGIAALVLLEVHRPDIAGRMIPLGPILVFLAAELLHQVSQAQSTYLRAFKQEPFLWISMAMAVVVGAGTVLLTPGLGAYGPAISYLAGMFVAALWGSFIFVRLRKQWTS